MKNKEFDLLIDEMSSCQKCVSLKSSRGVNCSLINIFKDKSFSKNIPSIWTDWYNRLDSSIFVIGQDWGPYNDMKKLRDEYIKDKTIDNWKRLIESEKSLTKKQFTKFLIESSNGKIENIDEVYFTNAIMCARRGERYRGNNINLKCSSINCSNYLKRQIEIVKPKVILTLGYFPLLSLSLIFGFSIEENLKKSIDKLSVIEIDRYVIIPLYHPVAQVKREVQLDQYRKIWNYL